MSATTSWVPLALFLRKRPELAGSVQAAAPEAAAKLADWQARWASGALELRLVPATGTPVARGDFGGRLNRMSRSHQASASAAPRRQRQPLPSPRRAAAADSWWLEADVPELSGAIAAWSSRWHRDLEGVDLTKWAVRARRRGGVWSLISLNGWLEFTDSATRAAWLAAGGGRPWRPGPAQLRLLAALETGPKLTRELELAGSRRALAAAKRLQQRGLVVGELVAIGQNFPQTRSWRWRLPGSNSDASS